MEARKGQKSLLLAGRIIWTGYVVLTLLGAGVLAPGSARWRLEAGLAWTVPWMLLTILLGYTALANAVGVSTARLLAVKTLAGGILILALAGSTGLFGAHLLFTSNAGWKLLELLPAFLPFLWMVLAGSAAVTAARLWPGGPLWGRSLVATLLFCLLLRLTLAPAEQYLLWWLPAPQPGPAPLPVFAGIPLLAVLLYVQMLVLPPPARFDLRGTHWRGPVLLLACWSFLFGIANLSLLLAHT